ncbi:MAG: hypothetical protein COB67_02870 [SAR324 cluster bacterium]|uniref:Uncharacterized protein n=1 Tax=SAR324 cluster bacterium TaxID=2024889 RepID=A0A2A4T9L0_9DELT|nr:MAG: hypothetical protein COB67_02870 [SAR324 cluster bacterium]
MTVILLTLLIGSFWFGFKMGNKKRDKTYIQEVTVPADQEERDHRLRMAIISYELAKALGDKDLVSDTLKMAKEKLSVDEQKFLISYIASKTAEEENLREALNQEEPKFLN